ncbi:Shedu anti-phage system protein SduA domain-containing protein [Daejeonella lutea]|uniref:Shedu protein SduA C-terminal domain-containing protein n=1 Tax=Daejeonella lutea TaxID=572036 RepID=A0A1T5B115_9SPHI|nr:Shedu anti-phage system protein SduA domain-containing protein [Daejeonella lutea]SKB40779.1 protein of unknown function [Daejeonella lutea]
MRNFNLYKIPVVLLLDENESKSFYQKHRYTTVLSDEGAEKLALHTAELASSIRNWRRQVIDELDNLGIEFNSGYIDYSLYFNTRRDTILSTEILSQNFQLFPRKLRYHWLGNNTRQIERAIDKFIGMLNRSDYRKKKAEELLYHRFFEDNPAFLERDRYSRTWHEAKLKLEDRKHYDPDFMMKPNFNYQTDLSLVEVKLPNEGFVQISNFHKTFLAKVFKHLSQVNDYKEYLEESSNNPCINSKFGFVPRKVDYNILIGRQPDKDENEHFIQKNIRKFNQHHIHLMTYDELLEYQVKFLNRQNLLKVS